MAVFWLKGVDLLQDIYNGDKLKMFEDIQKGLRVPLQYFGEIYGYRQILPNSESVRNIHLKAAMLKDLLFKLNADNKTLLRAHYRHINDLGSIRGEGHQDLFNVYAVSEEGARVLAEIESKRGHWKEEARSLKQEIGDPDSALAPDAVWRSVEFTPELQKKILEAYYKLELGSEGKIQKVGTLSNKDRLKIFEDKEIELRDIEKDENVRAAILCDNFDAKYWMIVQIFDIALPLSSKSKRPQRDKETMAKRMANKGRKILKQRQSITQ